MGSNASIPADQVRRAYTAAQEGCTLQKTIAKSWKNLWFSQQVSLHCSNISHWEAWLNMPLNILYIIWVNSFPHIIYKTTQSFKWKVTFNLKLISEIHPTSKTSAAMATLKWMERRLQSELRWKSDGIPGMLIPFCTCVNHTSFFAWDADRLGRVSWRALSHLTWSKITRETAKVKKAGSWKFVWRVCQHSKDHDHFPLWRRKDGIHSLTSGLMTLTPRIR